MTKRVHIELPGDLAQWWDSLPERARSKQLCEVLRVAVELTRNEQALEMLIKQRSIEAHIAEARQLTKELMHLQAQVKVVITNATHESTPA